MPDVCSHSWIDPLDPPLARSSYAPIVGTGRYQMKPGTVYVCRACGLRCRPIPSTDGPVVLSYQRESARPDLAHWSWGDAPRNGPDEQTACGRWVRATAIVHHPDAVTCPACQAQLAWADTVEI